MNITLLDTSVATDNLGDEIIMDAVESVVRSLFPDAYTYRVATHEYMSKVSRDILKRSELAFICGTNILCSYMGYKPQWKLRPWDVGALNRSVACGVGWRRYASNPDPYSAWLLRQILKNSKLHSVRDRYTRQKLENLGIRAENTSCPTMWSLSPERCASIPAKKADSVITTLTFYLPSPESDKAVLECLSKNYKNVYFWSQQSQDREYLESLAVARLKFVAPSVAAYNSYLEAEDTDFVGLRLHGGIRALQKGRRALILPVDNRATEISRDTGLPIMDRADIPGIEDWIRSPQPTIVNLPNKAIANWKQQFQ